jgi:HEPN domain-containing protein
MESRYPDAAQGVPYELFTDADSADHIRAAEVIEQWVLQRLRPTP